MFEINYSLLKCSVVKDVIPKLFEKKGAFLNTMPRTYTILQDLLKNSEPKGKWEVYQDGLISDILHIQPPIFPDNRGYLMETFNASVFEENGIPLHFISEIESNSRQGTIRGLHYQIKHVQGKLVRVSKGKIFTVVVDLRRNSQTFGQWTHIEISSDNKKILWIPPGFAHGFYALSKYARVVYKVTEIYAPKWERILTWNDPTLKIKWPLIGGVYPILSKKDSQGKCFHELECFEFDV